MSDEKKTPDKDYGALRFDDPMDSIFLDMMAEGMHPEGKEKFLRELLKEPLARIPSIGPDDSSVKFQSSMLLPPDKRAEHRKALAQFPFDARPERKEGEPFTDYSRRIINLAAQKALAVRDE